MSIALSEEHQELARVARAFLVSHDVRSESRALLEAPLEGLPSFWKEMAELGWMGLHISEAHGGQGFGLRALAIVVDELGFAMAAGPFRPMPRA
nr:acyl-CoA dehydrogenase family protein [Pseudomonadota bacterium]